MNKSREQRERYNSEERDQEVPQIPKLKDMGKMTERLSNDLLKWANQLERLGNYKKKLLFSLTFGKVIFSKKTDL